MDSASSGGNYDAEDFRRTTLFSVYVAPTGISRRMSGKTPRQLLMLAVAVGSGMMAAQAQAASASWINTSSDAWSDGAAWSTGTAPGAIGGVTSTDTATFNSSTSVSILGFSSGRNIQSLLFSTPGTTVNNYNFLNSGNLNLSAGGTITADSTYQGVVNIYNLTPVLDGSATYNSSGGFFSVCISAPWPRTLPQPWQCDPDSHRL